MQLSDFFKKLTITFTPDIFLGLSLSCDINKHDVSQLSLFLYFEK